jgi:hypothetical protein
MRQLSAEELDQIAAWADQPDVTAGQPLVPSSLWPTHTRTEGLDSASFNHWRRDVAALVAEVQACRARTENPS